MSQKHNSFGRILHRSFEELKATYDVAQTISWRAAWVTLRAKVDIQIIAENGYTTKQYKVNVYRRNEEEQKIADEEAKINIQKLNAILEVQEENEGLEEKNQNEDNIIENIKRNLWFVVIYFIFSIIIIIFVILTARTV